MQLPHIPATTRRVECHTSPSVQARIEARMQQRVQRYAGAPPHEITRRIEALEHEWDIERWLETNAATASLIGIALGTLVDRRWFALPAVVAGFLLQHAVQGWCPPLPAFRRLGVRTAHEIHAEIVELRRLRGDFVETAGATRRAQVDTPRSALPVR
jgi:hypothetical protein